MKYKFTLLNLLMLFAFFANAQDLTGIWKGYFVQRSFGLGEDRYRFEIQIEQLSNNGINGVTYSYKTTVFYGKANLKGLYTKKTKNLVLTETKLVEVKIEGQSEACLMTCYLDYDKLGNLETLTGTYTSRNVRDNGDCGSGRVYLEKSTTSDFYKEDFLVKRENAIKRKQDEAARKKALAARPKPTPKPANPPADKKGIKPGAEENVIVKKDVGAPAIVTPPPAPKEETVTVPKPSEKIDIPKPEAIKKRSNELVKTLETSATELTIDLYDNGEIDGDIISVYHNNQLIASKKLLGHKPISFTIKLDQNSPTHEFVMVAENLGSIPPNTAMMVITAGSKRHELFITSTEQKNAVVVIEYNEKAK